jgi:hypothetical protein
MAHEIGSEQLQKDRTAKYFGRMARCMSASLMPASRCHGLRKSGPYHSPPTTKAIIVAAITAIQLISHITPLPLLQSVAIMRANSIRDKQSENAYRARIMATKIEAAPRVEWYHWAAPRRSSISERILTRLRADGYAMSARLSGRRCRTGQYLRIPRFSAKEESLAAIGEAIAENGRVIVTGCMGNEAELIRARFPEVLAVTGAHQYEDVVAAVHEAAPPARGAFRRSGPPEGGFEADPAPLQLSEDFRRLQS